MSDMQLVIICLGVVVCFCTFMFYLVMHKQGIHEEINKLNCDTIYNVLERIEKLEEKIKDLEKLNRKTQIDAAFTNSFIIELKKSWDEISHLYKKEEDDALSTKST